MKNDEPGGITAMERLAWQLMYAVCDFADASRGWCKKNNVDLRGENRSRCMKLAHHSIESRIYEARKQDMATSEALRNASAELDALREAGRVMPEGVSWPRYTDGGPVRIGDEMVLGRVHEVSVTAGGCSLTGSGGSILAEVPSGALIHRPAHKAVGADGVEVKAGDTVWLAPERRGMAQCGTRESGDTCGLSGVDALDRLAVVYTRDRSGVPIASLDRCQAWCPASWLTHTAPCTDKDGAPIDEGDEVWTEDGCRWKVLGIKSGGHPLQAKCVEGCHRGKRRDLKWTWVSHERPDSWGRLREDARKVYTAYWGCIGFCCDKCPALVDGKDPIERYSTANCHDAMSRDLVARAERTCRDFGGEEGTNGEGYDFACSRCGYCCDLPQPNFCPSCGARVEDGGDGDE